jgi:membrane protease YdiL (CAAX protease family)
MKAERAWLAFALVYPTLLAWGYFVLLDGAEASHFQQAAYAGGKAFQLALPVIVLCLVERRVPRPGRPRFAGLALGLAFGVLVVAGMLALYHVWLKHTPIFEGTAEQVARKLRRFGLDTPARYLWMTLFVAIPHSLMEEYYWRWFVFGRLRRHVAFPAACLLSSLGFMAHHVIVLAVYLPGYFLVGVVPLSLCIACGGAMWAWLYERTGTIYAAWLSHLLVDAGVFAIGYDLLRGTLW